MTDQALATTPSAAELRRAKAVGWSGCQLGLDRVPGVVLADVLRHDVLRHEHDPDPWVTPGHAIARVWGGKADQVQRSIREIQGYYGLVVVLEHRRATRWSRVIAWVRVALWPVRRWLERMVDGPRRS